MYGLRDLQQYLQQYPSCHYSHAGREPLQYVLVLVLTQQWTEAAAYLAQDPAARDLRVDAVYFCVALTQVGLLRDGADNATIGRRLHITERTVANHLTAALAATGCPSRTSLVVEVLRGRLRLRTHPPRRQEATR